MRESGPVGLGVIGAGSISTQYLTNLARFPDVEVRFVADLDLDRAAAQAATHGVTRSGSVDELLADDEIDIVINLTIPAAHVAIAEQVLESGRHVWNEKPFALDRESGTRLLDRARATGLRVATAPDTFLGAGIQSALRALAVGDIGTPRSALTLMQSPGPERWHPNPGFLYDIGGGPLFDLGPYYLTALVQFFGSVQRVQASTAKARNERLVATGPQAGRTVPVRVPTYVSTLLEFENGAVAQSLFSFDSPLRRMQFEVAGDDATLVVPDPNMFSGDLTFVRDGTDAKLLPCEGATAGRGVGVVELARAIRAGEPERASGDLAFHVLDVMQSIVEAGEASRPVSVESSAPPARPLPAEWDPTEATLT